MARAKKEEVAEVPEKKGRAIVLPNGVRRVDYIRDEYYKNSKTRSEIKNAINEMLPEDEQIPYQIVFAATKTETDPRDEVKEAS